MRQLREQLERAEKGLVTGLIYVVSTTDEGCQMGLSGEFADDFEFATDAANDAFSALVGLSHPRINSRRGLPRDLKEKS